MNKSLELAIEEAAEEYADAQMSGSLFKEKKNAFLAGIAHARANPDEDVRELVEAARKVLTDAEKYHLAGGEYSDEFDPFTTLESCLIKFEAKGK